MGAAPPRPPRKPRVRNAASERAPAPLPLPAPSPGGEGGGEGAHPGMLVPRVVVAPASPFRPPLPGERAGVRGLTRSCSCLEWSLRPPPPFRPPLLGERVGVRGLTRSCACLGVRCARLPLPAPSPGGEGRGEGAHPQLLVPRVVVARASPFRPPLLGERVGVRGLTRSCACLGVRCARLPLRPPLLGERAGGEGAHPRMLVPRWVVAPASPVLRGRRGSEAPTTPP